MTDAPRPLLLCTVGGSPQPIATALARVRPAAVWFICSDGSGVSKSSTTEVTEPIVVYNKATGRMGPGLKFAEGCPEDNSIVRVPPDDPDRAFAQILACLGAIRTQFPKGEIIADYTGGTKTMSAALLMAAMAFDVTIQFMQGRRSDLVKVEDGTEEPARISSTLITADRERATALAAMEGYDYAATEAQLDRLLKRIEGSPAKPVKSWTAGLTADRDAARCLAAWDRFDHGEARKLLSAAWDAGKDWATALDASGHRAALEALADSGKDRPGWLLCADLWRNAERRAARGRYDDAVARCYRLVEATVQAQLFTRYGLLTESIPETEVPPEWREGLRFRWNPKLKHYGTELPLDRSARLLLERDARDPVGLAYSSDNEHGRPAWLSKRNNSILAHGFSAVGAGVWTEIETWIGARFRQFWSKQDFPQLPTATARGTDPGP